MKTAITDLRPYVKSVHISRISSINGYETHSVTWKDGEWISHQASSQKRLNDKTILIDLKKLLPKKSK